jgi:hypothetical protein
VKSGYQVKTSEIRLRKLSVEISNTPTLQLFVVTTYKWSINLVTNPNPVYSN